MSKYQQLYDHLTTQIEKGLYRPGQLLPSETVLMKETGYGRETIRKSLNMLAANGYIQKEQGKGSRVIHKSSTHKLYDLAAYPYIPGQEGLDTIVHDVRLIMPTGEISKNLNQKERGKVWKITRTRFVNGHAAVLETDYVDSSLVPALDVETAEEDGWKLAKDKTGLDISYSRKEISLKPASAKEAQTLKLKEGTTLAVVRSWTYLENTAQLQYTVAKHNPEFFLYHDFLRTKNAM